MGLLMPLILGGLALAGIPWIIHRIRKPTSNPTPFSSLMFVPVTTPPLRQRRKIEHPWLMLLRIAMLAALAIAFSRPYTLAPAAADLDDGKTRQHVLLLDTSLSMSVPGQLDNALDAARTRLDELEDEAVAVVAFDDAPRVLAPFSGPADADAGTVRRARSALDTLAPSFGSTHVIPALQRAEQLLQATVKSESSTEEDVPDRENVIHLVSDLQRSALPEDMAHYGLARGVSLRLIPVPAPDPANLAVEAVALEARPPSTLYARVRLRNYGTTPAESMLTWRLDDATAAEQVVSLPPDSSVVVALSTQADLSRPARVEMRLSSNDPVAADNSHFTVYAPEPIRAIGVVIDAAADTSQPIPFLEAAIAESQPVPWKLAPVDPAALPAIDVGPAILVLPGVDHVTPESAAKLAAYVEGGGRLLLIPSATGFATSVTEALLQPASVTGEGARFDEADPARYALLSWMDYNHPVFLPFRNAAYSDFSMLRFHNYFNLRVDPAAPSRVIARLESDSGTEGAPAIIAIEKGAGRIVVWAFPLNPDWTNLTRTRRFIPLLHETIALLLPSLPPPRTHRAGALLSPPPELALDGLTLQLPGESDARPFQAIPAGGPSASPGFLHWVAASADAAPLIEPVNTDPAESDLRVFTPEEFLLRIGAVSDNVAQSPAAAPQREQNVVHWEYGYHVLVLLAAACLIESTLAAYLGRPAPREQPTR